MKWGKKDAENGLTRYWFDWEGKISLQDCWNAVTLLSKMGELDSILVVELHDASDASVAGKSFESAEDFSKWAKEQNDAPEYDGGYELDHAEVFTIIDSEMLKIEVLPSPLWVGRGKSRTKLTISYVTDDEGVGSKAAKAIKKFKIEEGA